ncbi:metallophosphoesterase [Dysosmobacter sp.]|uniref:metallophosphoesterase n=1 Tax=Dysosmobacter sp. TaxID=2591382 RepID=UPI002A84B85D|nr:metallophosphoesterase [Dysosmobacter sp.]MDY3986091.1 metallophosphoesterase [Dysosmobacter sp.]
MAKHPRNRRLFRTLRRLLLAVILLGAFLWWSNTSLETASFDLTFTDLPAGFEGCRAVVLSDLHTAEFGAGSQRLLEAVQEAEPDYIFLTGDLLDQYRPVPEGYVEQLADSLSAIAPTYYITGNHEWALGGVPALKELLITHGVTVLSNQFLPLERDGDAIVLAGIDDPNGYADQKTPETVAAELYAACGDPFWVLLAHRNDRFESQYSLLGADLVISGHAHGGIIRLPFLGGLISHDLELFPDYTAGLHEQNGSALFVSRGLGNVGASFRLFNRPEVAVLTLHRG